MIDTSRHGMDGPPCCRIHAMMSCRPCPRTPVGDVSGLNIKPGNDDLQFAPMRFRGNERTKSPSLRRNHAQPLGLALRTRLAAPEPDLHAVEIKINDRRGVERQELAQREAADHGVAERLAQLRSRAV